LVYPKIKIINIIKNAKSNLATKGLIKQMIKKKGFTLIELLVVIAIIGLLSTLAVVYLNGARQRARDAASQSDAKTLQTALEVCATQGNSYPSLTPAGQLNMTNATCGDGVMLNQFLQEFPAGNEDHLITYESDGTTYTIQYWSEAIDPDGYLEITGGGSGF